MPDQPETPVHGAAIFPRLFFQALGAGALAVFSLGLGHVACWGVFALSALIAWPLWVYRNEVILFERRMVLEHLTRPDSGIRRWLWAGTLTRVLQAVLSLALALLLLVLVARLGAEQWAVLALDVLLLSLLVNPIRRGLRGQVQDRRLGLVARRWPLLGLNVVALTLGFVALDFFVIGTPDTRALPWNQVAEDAFRAEGLDAVCTPAGWALGALAAVEALTRHAAQLSIPSLPDPALRIAAWGLVLVHVGALAYLFTRMQLGIIALVEYRTAPKGAEGAFSRAFLYTILALAIPYLYATSRLARLDTAELAARARQAVDWADPCQADPAAREAVVAALSADLDRARLQAQGVADQRVDAEMDALFARIEPGVDAYLDWYFTVLGEYERLAAAATGGFAGLMAEQLQRHLFTDTGFAEQLQRLDDTIRRESVRALADATGDLGQRAAAHSASSPCALSGLDLKQLSQSTLDLSALGDLDRDGVRAAAAVGGGAAAGAVAAKLLAKQTGAAVAAKLTAKKGFQVAAGLGGKVAAKKGGSILLSAAGGAALCAPGGPAAAICGIVAGAAAWLAVDKAMIEIDEARLREQMRAEILQSLADQRPALAQAIKDSQHAAIDAAAGTIQAGIRRVFVPARDGL